MCVSTVIWTFGYYVVSINALIANRTQKIIESNECNAFTIPSTLDYLPTRIREERRANYENEAKIKTISKRTNGRSRVCINRSFRFYGQRTFDGTTPTNIERLIYLLSLPLVYVMREENVFCVCGRRRRKKIKIKTTNWNYNKLPE